MKNQNEIIFSIIIPTFNSEKTISKSLRSVISQKDKTEIILVDDLSNDKTLSIIKKFKKKYKSIKIYKNTKNLGVSLTRNKGIKKAKGKYIIFLDSDDYLFNGCLQKLRTFIDKNKNPDVVFGRFEKETFPKNNDLIIKNLPKNTENKIAFKKLILKKKFPLDECWPYIVKREFLEINNINFFNVRVAEDQLYVLRIFLKMRSFYIFKDNFYCHRNLPGTLSDFMNFKYSKCCIEVVIEYLKLYKKEKNILNKKLINQYIQSCLSMFVGIFITLQKNNIKEISKILKRNNVRNYKVFFYKKANLSFQSFVKKYGYFKGLLKLKQNIIQINKDKLKKFMDQKKEIYFLCYSKFLNASSVILGKKWKLVKFILDENKSLNGRKFKGKIIINPKKILNNINYANKIIVINNHREITIKKIINYLLKNKFPKKNIATMNY